MGHAYKNDDLLKTTKAISSTYFLNKVHDYVVMYTKKKSAQKFVNFILQKIKL